jgi:organic radical activating enzyme
MQLVNPEVRIENSSHCNARCKICPRETMTRPRMTMDTDTFFNLVDEAQDLGAKTISVFGYGEPLMDPELAQKVDYCTRMGLGTFITTNASMLDPVRSQALFDAGLKHIRFSVHGLCDEDYENVHQGLSFQDTMRNISRFMEMNSLRNGNGCQVSVSHIITKRSQNIEDIKKAWLGVDFLEIWRPHNWAGGRAAYRMLHQTKKTCGRPENGPIQINADGKVMVCCFDYDGKLTVGDTNTHSLEAIIKGDAFNRIREKHRSGDLSGLVCESCDQLNEGDNPLLYSSRDPKRRTGMTSSMKFNINN